MIRSRLPYMCDNLKIEAANVGLQSPVSVPSGRYSVQSRQWDLVVGQIMLLAPSRIQLLKVCAVTRWQAQAGSQLLIVHAR
jgi:hypothetical protein